MNRLQPLTFTHLAMLAAVQWYDRSEFKPPARARIFPPGGLVNQWREEFEVDDWSMMPLTSVKAATDFYNKLLELGFLEEEDSVVRLTDKGEWLLSQVGGFTNWRRWPLEFSINEDGFVIHESAIY